MTSLDLSKETDALALPSGTTAQRPASPINGMIRYNDTSGITGIEAFVNGAWTSLLTGGSGGGVTIDLGTSAASTNPQRNGDATTGLFSPAVSTVAVAVGGAQKLTVNGTGVGIGTSSPSAMLDVGGGSSGSLYIGEGSSGALQLTGNSGTGNAVINNANTAGGDIDIQSRGASAVYIKEGGNVGIGTTSPADSLQVATGDLGIGTANSKNAGITLYQSSNGNPAVIGFSNDSLYIESDNNGAYQLSQAWKRRRHDGDLRS